MGTSYCRQNLCVNKLCDAKVPQEEDHLIELPNGHEGTNIAQPQDDVSKIFIRQFSSTNSKQFDSMQIKPSTEGKKVRFKHNNTLMPSRNSSNAIKQIMMHSKVNNLSLQPGVSDYVMLPEKISREDYGWILEVLKSIIIFQVYDDGKLGKIIEHFTIISIKRGSYLLRQGDNSLLFFFIVSKGRLEYESLDGMRRINERECFGENALVELTQPKGSIKALENSTIYVLSNKDYKLALQIYNDLRLRDKLYFLQNYQLFKYINNVHMNLLAENINTVHYKEKDFIIVAGSEGDSMYILKEGIVSCINTSGEEVRKLNVGSFFGEYSILFGLKRSLDCVAETAVVCFEISKKILLESLGSQFKQLILFSIFKNALEKNAFFNGLVVNSDYDTLFGMFKLTKYASNEIVFPKDDTKMEKKIIVLIEGNLVQGDNSQIVAERGELFGDSILQSSVLEYNIISYPNCICLETPWSEIIKTIKVKVDVMNLNSYEGDLLNKSESDNDNSYVTLYKQLNNLRKISMFREISDSKLISIIRVMRKEAFEKGMTIVKEGQDGDKFYLIVKGKVKITKNGNFLRMYEEGNCFGEVSLLENCIRTATVTAQSDCICWVLSKNYFNTVIDSTLKEYLTKKMALINSNISLEELYYIKFLGQGKFGSVDLVHNGKNIYAVKRISKAAVEKDDYLISYLLNERRIMLCLDHPFIIKLVKTLKDRSNCYYLMEYIPGECLEFHLDNRRSSNKKSSSPITSTIYHTQFYTASLLLVLNYLNNKNIAHRDLKPSNIMVDRNGYLKLIDFGTAKIIRDYTDTVIGTPHYIAPEVISGKGYSITLDYWSLGIMLYEMVYGVLPFAHNANQVMDIYKAILFSGFRLLEGNEFKFSDSDDVSVDDVNQLLKTLLQKKHSKRICNFKELKGFSFFKNFNFEELIDFNLTAPKIPSIKDTDADILRNTSERYVDYLDKTADSFYSDGLSSGVHGKLKDRTWDKEF